MENKEINIYPIRTFRSILGIRCIGRGAVLFGSKRRVNATQFPKEIIEKHTNSVSTSLLSVALGSSLVTLKIKKVHC